MIMAITTNRLDRADKALLSFSKEIGGRPPFESPSARSAYFILKYRQPDHRKGSAVAFRVYQDSRLIKQIKNLMKGGGHAALAANHAQKIVESFTVQSNGGVMRAGRLTRNGEARIMKCIKFDLVYGYRLVGIMRDEAIKFTFVGSHGECDHWIKNNSGVEPVLKNSDIQIVKPAHSDTSGDRDPIPPADEPDYDELILRDVTDQELRIIFRGLCGG